MMAPKTLIAAALVLVTASCDTAQEAVTKGTRDTAKTVVNQVVETRFPGVNAAPITDCIIDNASVSEILTIAKASVVGIQQDTVDTVVGISQRPETAACIAKNSLKLLG
ncbi:succinate dehydrogenase [Amylibacter sp. IMCC11727]|uniref:succinate dehydrogenase n=1 Tax=Amylibacter sp. IMCC11727 TaxID=3039851 RepID=UPI00244DA1A5|nr:succinate dehydrogenase [Amylibacter sp. IMCC11727]WGI23142.1 succinate dehydrogenase [Amylibacter sp. IMCC11727]